MMNGNSNNANSSNIIYTPEWEWVLQNEYFWWFEKIVKSNSLKIFVVYSSEQSSRFSSSSSSLVECIAQYWSWLALCVANKWQSTIWILQKQSKREFSVFFHIFCLLDICLMISSFHFCLYTYNNSPRNDSE